MAAVVWESLPWLPHCTLICEQHLALCCLDTCSSTELRAQEVIRESSLVMCLVGIFSLLFVLAKQGEGWAHCYKNRRCVAYSLFPLSTTQSPRLWSPSTWRGSTWKWMNEWMNTWMRGWYEKCLSNHRQTLCIETVCTVNNPFDNKGDLNMDNSRGFHLGWNRIDRKWWMDGWMDKWMRKAQNHLSLCFLKVKGELSKIYKFSQI